MPPIKLNLLFTLLAHAGITSLGFSQNNPVASPSTDVSASEEPREASSFSELGVLDPETTLSPEIKEKDTRVPTTIQSNGRANQVEFISSEDAFEGDCPDLPLIDFEGIGPSAIIACSHSVNSTTNDACFNPGDLPAGITFTANPRNLVRLGEAIIGSATDVFGPDVFADDLEFTFDPGTNAVGFELKSAFSGAKRAGQLW